MILVKLIGIGNDDKDENDSIEKEGYKYNEDKCNNKDNDDDDSDNDDDWKIECIDVIVRLVSITPGHVKLDWLPPPKVDRINDNKNDNKNKEDNNENEKNISYSDDYENKSDVYWYFNDNYESNEINNGESNV